MSQVSFTRIVELLAAQGVPASIDGTIWIATLHIGTSHHQDGWGERYQLLAGPGENRRPWGDAWGETEELAIGRDDDGSTPVLRWGRAEDTEETLAAAIVGLLADLATQPQPVSPGESPAIGQNGVS